MAPTPDPRKKLPRPAPVKGVPPLLPRKPAGNAAPARTGPAPSSRAASIWTSYCRSPRRRRPSALLRRVERENPGNDPLDFRALAIVAAVITGLLLWSALLRRR